MDLNNLYDSIFINGPVIYSKMYSIVNDEITISLREDKDSKNLAWVVINQSKLTFKCSEGTISFHQLSPMLAHDFPFLLNEFINLSARVMLRRSNSSETCLDMWSIISKLHPSSEPILNDLH
jgi:hypothetical protein